MSADAMEEMKADCDRIGRHITDLLNRLDVYRETLKTKVAIIQTQLQTIMELERENAELREKCVEVN